MTTLRDVKMAGTKLNDFRSKASFFKLEVIALSSGNAERLPEIITSRQELNEQATSLFEEVGKQICADHGVAWGTTPEGLTDDTTISDEAENKFRVFLDFITSN